MGSKQIDNGYMTRWRIVDLCTLTVPWCLLGACVSPRLSPLNFSVQPVSSSSREEVFAAAEKTLVELGHRIDRRDPTTGLLTTIPVAGTRRDTRIRTSLSLSSPGRLRRVTQVRVREVAGQVTLYCKVAVQQQTTQTYRMLAPEYTGGDLPAATPIEREAATTARQNTVWETLRRDRTAEQEILDAMVHRLEATRRSDTPRSKP